jgi:heme exporter protein C
MSIWKYSNPAFFMSLSQRILPGITIFTLILLLVGLYWGFFLTPNDYQQGSSVKIIFLHVPAALVAINTWFVMLISSLIWLVRRHHISALIAKAAAPIGLIMTLIAIITGMIWGQQMWGTYWAWDPRLTSFLILFLFYVGYQTLWGAIENPDTAADLTSILCLVGTVFAILSRYAVNFWSQGLHQGASLSLDKEEHIHDAFSNPLYICIIGFISLFLTLVILRTRTEIIKRQINAIERRRGNS